MNKVIYIAKNVKCTLELSVETINAIERARKRIKEGRFVTEAQATKRLGM